MDQFVSLLTFIATQAVICVFYDSRATRQPPHHHPPSTLFERQYLVFLFTGELITYKLWPTYVRGINEISSWNKTLIEEKIKSKQMIFLNCRCKFWNLIFVWLLICNMDLLYFGTLFFLIAASLSKIINYMPNSLFFPY